MASKYNNQNTIDQEKKKCKDELQTQLAQLYDDYLDANTTQERECISSKISNMEVKLLQYEKSTCAISNPSGINEISTITLKRNI